MAYAPRRRRCPQCRQMREFKDKRRKCCSIACEVARRRAAGFFQRFAAAGNGAIQRRSARQMVAALRAAGASPEVIAMARRFRDAAYSAGSMAGEHRGFRKGFAAACGENYRRDAA